MPDPLRCPACHARFDRPEGGEAGRPIACPTCGAPMPETAEIELDSLYAPPAAPGETPGGFSLGVSPTLTGKFAEAFRLLGSNLPLLAALILTVRLPGNLLLSYLVAGKTPEEAFRPSLQVNGFVEGVFGPLYSAAIIYTLWERKHARPVSYVRAMAAGARAWWRLWVVRLIGGLLMLLGFFALIVPGILLALRFAFMDPVAVIEEARDGAALERSATLTRGRRALILAAMLLAFLIELGVAVVLEGLSKAVPALDTVAGATATLCVLNVLSLLSTTVLFLYYWEARAIEEVEYAAELARGG